VAARHRTTVGDFQSEDRTGFDSNEKINVFRC
jgi:hypothetical protein